MINDVSENIKHSKIQFFVDDIVLYKEISTVNDAQQLQEDLDLLQLCEGTWLYLYQSVMSWKLQEPCTKHKISLNYIACIILHWK